MSKLWIIGDSFTGASPNGKSSWVDILCKKFKGKKHYVSSRGSRDFQTILDIFLRNLKNISKDDFVIIVIPFLGRTRLPLRTPLWDVELSNFMSPETTLDFFIGNHSYITEKEELSLEEPLTNSDDSDINKKCDIWSIVNSSNASKQNYIEILKSLKEYLPFEIFIWSWENEIKSDIVLTKNKIKDEIGFWHTNYDLYKETNGNGGIRGDAHFSIKMHNAFAKYIIDKFPQFFENE